jgi:hypothetical protein
MPRSTAPLGPALGRLLAHAETRLVRVRGLIAALDRTGLRDAAAIATMAEIDPSRVAAMPAAGWWIIDLGEARDESRGRAALETRGFYTSPILTTGSEVRLFVVPRLMVSPAADREAQALRALAGQGLRSVRASAGLILAEADVVRAEDVAALVAHVRGTGLVESAEAELGVIAPAPVIDAAPREPMAPDQTPIALTVLGLEAEAPSSALVSLEADLSEFGLMRGRFVTTPAMSIGVFAGGARTLVFTSQWLAALHALSVESPGVLLDSTGADVAPTSAAEHALRALLDRGWIVVRGSGRASMISGPTGERTLRTATSPASAAAAAALARVRLLNATPAEIFALLARTPLSGVPGAIDPIRVARAARPQADLDGDGRVSSADLLVLQRLIEADDLRRADVNGDGVLDDADLLTVLGALD